MMKLLSVQRILLLQTVLLAIIPSSMEARRVEEELQCANVDSSQELGTSSTVFDTVKAGYELSWKNRGLMPDKIHWHIYAIPEGEVPRYSVFPNGVLKPKVSGNTLSFLGQKNALKDLGYSRGDKIRAGVTLYIPMDQLQTVRVDGVDQSVEVLANDDSLFSEDNATDPATMRLDIRGAGVDSSLYVDTPFHQVHYRGSGVDGLARIVSASGATVKISGVDQNVHIRTPRLDDGSLDGVDQYLLVQTDDYGEIRLSGVDSKVNLKQLTTTADSLTCNDVRRDGVDSSCSVTTTKTVTVPTLSCMVDTKVIWGCADGICLDMSTGAAIGVAVACCFIVACCIGLCCFCCGCCGRRRQKRREMEIHHQVPVPPPPSAAYPMVPTLSAEKEQQPGVVEAEVIAMKPPTEDQDPEQPMMREPYVANTKTQAQPY